MAARDKIRERVTPYLEPGEQIHAVVPCQTGPSPMYNVLTYLVLFWVKYWIVVATDRNVVVFRAGTLSPFKPKAVDRRLPRATRFGPLSGLWGKSQILGVTTYVHKRFQKDAEAADAMAGDGQPAAAQATAVAGGPAAAWYPDPNTPGLQRYWDGSAWTEHTAPG